MSPRSPFGEPSDSWSRLHNLPFYKRGQPVDGNPNFAAAEKLGERTYQQGQTLINECAQAGGHYHLLQYLAECQI
ncbi:hypothetical protein HG15A2_15130 [Adhaeretor mobilis]|uniref:Uncharacterized protein n=1 Tax=Adhaeretor mobilis TaxID=1930276 RepID=A0A517MTM9_9BACT|nr:hypothetical protein HG15A2_15130 [Adhaeretor mobilis]